MTQRDGGGRKFGFTERFRVSRESNKWGWEGKFLKSVCYRIFKETAEITMRYKRKSGNCLSKSHPSMVFELQMLFQDISSWYSLDFKQFILWLFLVFCVYHELLQNLIKLKKLELIAVFVVVLNFSYKVISVSRFQVGTQITLAVWSYFISLF